MGFASPSDALLERLKACVGASGWKAPTDAPRYFEDPRGRFEGQGALVLMPSSTAQVSEIVALCAGEGVGVIPYSGEGVGVIPYSGGTGVVAGQLSIDDANAVIVSLEKMNAVREISADDAVMVVEAGCILENVHAAALDVDMIFPLGMASKGSCCIGGNLATNAGGIQE